jgi:hypothetical protein
MADFVEVNKTALRVAHLATKTFEGITEQSTLDRAIVDMGKAMGKLDDEVIRGAMSRLDLTWGDVVNEGGVPVRWVLVDEKDASKVLLKNGAVLETGNGNACIFHNYSSAEAVDMLQPAGYVWCQSDLTYGTPVLADLHTDDYVADRTVDIRPWLMVAEAEEIEELIKREWDGSTERDNIAHHLENIGDPSAIDVFGHKLRSPYYNNGETNGFEIDLDDAGEAVIAWLKVNRKDVVVDQDAGMAP